MAETEHALTEQSLELGNKLKDEESKYQVKKKEYTSLNDETKDLENNLSNIQRKLSENEAKASEVISKEIRNNYEIKFKEKEKGS